MVRVIHHHGGLRLAGSPHPPLLSGRPSDLPGFYQKELLDSLDFEYFVTADQCDNMQVILHKHKEWAPYVSKDGVTTGQEMAEIDYVMTFSSQTELKLRSRAQRFIAIRKPKDGQLKFDETPYVCLVIVTNTEEKDLCDILRRHWGRCGSIEYTYSQLKSGCGMRRMPSSKFDVNAAWLSLGILTHNVLKMIQDFALPENLSGIEIKTLTFRFIRSAATIINRGRRTVIRICKGSILYKLYKEATQNLEHLAYRLSLLNKA
ncbi:MAG: transposase [Deltaproteobacteria bacterium]|nr:transposase [Deltaproteobacteria bacterium]